jgi:ubiquinone/menaquinone biosynthesis C-methylase UbiE
MHTSPRRLSMVSTRRLGLGLALALLMGTAAVAAGCSGSPRSTPAPAASASAGEAGVARGLNDRFLSDSVDVAEFVRTFEGESREIAAQRQGITLHLGLRPGMAVADVGAGTGLFMEELAHGVGREGRVYAVDLAPAFVEHLRERARDQGLEQVQVVQCSERSIGLPAASIDVAFVCDTYHHFDYPQSSLASLREALKPDGLLVIVDFERRPESRQWVLEHVRADSAQVITEIEAAGFRLIDRPAVAGLQENYLLRFRKSAD